MACALSESPPFLFVHIPKTGGSSLFSRESDATKRIEAQCKGFRLMLGHHSIGQLSEKRDVSKYQIFTIVRNPYDRFISIWLNRHRNVGVSLNNYITGLKSKTFRWNPGQPQHKWVLRSTGLEGVRVLKFERYSNDLYEFMAELGIKLGKLPHLRKTRREKDYHFYIKTEKHWKRLNRLYAKDFELFNYPMEHA